MLPAAVGAVTLQSPCTQWWCFLRGGASYSTVMIQFPKLLRRDMRSAAAQMSDMNPHVATPSRTLFRRAHLYIWRKGSPPLPSRWMKAVRARRLAHLGTRALLLFELFWTALECRADGDLLNPVRYTCSQIFILGMACTLLTIMKNSFPPHFNSELHALLLVCSAFIICWQKRGTEINAPRLHIAASVCIENQTAVAPATLSSVLTSRQCKWWAPLAQLGRAPVM